MDGTVAHFASNLKSHAILILRPSDRRKRRSVRSACRYGRYLRPRLCYEINNLAVVLALVSLTENGQLDPSL
jgi:hypothetical protein